VQDVCDGWVEGFNANDVTTVQLNYGDRLAFYDKAIETMLGDGHESDAIRVAAKQIEAACFSVWPDWVVFITGFCIPIATMQLIRTRGIKVCLALTESPYQDDEQLIYASHADLVTVNDPIGLDRFLAVNERSEYVPHGYSPARIAQYAQPNEDYASDFCFVGTGFPSRQRFFEKVEWPEGRVCQLAGWWGALPDESNLHRLIAHPLDQGSPNNLTLARYASTKVSANLYRRESNRPELSDGWAMGPREVELAASGTFFLRERRGESDEVFGDILPTFSTPEEFSDLLAYWLDERRDEERRQRANAAQAAVADRSFPNIISRVLRLLTKDQ
jgi:hypothetical protein